MAGISLHPSIDSVNWAVYWLTVLLHRQSRHLLICSFFNHVFWTNSLFSQLNPPYGAREPNEADIYRGTNSFKQDRRKEQNPSGAWHYKICVKTKRSTSTRCVVMWCLLLMQCASTFKKLSFCIFTLLTYALLIKQC